MERKDSPTAARDPRAIWRAISAFFVRDLRGKIAALDDEKLVLLREGVYRNARALKGVHIRMVTDECARRGL